MDVATRIRLAREQMKMTQKDLAKRLRIGQSAISQWESGATLPDIENRLRLMVVLRLPFSELLPESDHVSKDLMKSPKALQVLQLFFQLPPEQQETAQVILASLVEKYRSSR